MLAIERKPQRGRPPGLVHDRLIQMRVSGEFIRSVDDWRRQQDDLPSRTEAIRRLIEQALQGGKKRR